MHTERQEPNRSFPTTWTHPRHELWKRRVHRHHCPLGAQDFDAIGIPHIWTEIVHVGRPCSGSVARPRLSCVELDPSSSLECRCQEVVDLPSSMREAKHIHIIQESEQVFTGSKFSLTSAKASWLAKLKRRGMRGSPCSPPSCCWMSCRTPSLSTHL